MLDVNYGGSTGYGREYRQRLNGQWGVVDVDDVVNGARFLVEQGVVDPKRLCIDGGSAGGYTTLCALTFRDAFKAGASHYGISDMEALAHDTHKFESRYCDNMIGPYPERRDLYIERSPIHFVDRLATPLILFQGLEDKVVPPSQSLLMFEAVKAKGLPWPISRSKASSTAFARRKTCAARWKQNRTSIRRCSGSAWPTRLNRCRSKISDAEVPHACKNFATRSP